MAGRGKDPNSVETILTSNDDDNLSDWSIVWSTSQVPGMDTARGGGSSRRRKTGRRRLRLASLALCSMLTMHCHITSSALLGGYFIFMLLLIPSVALLANPLRHFEVYLGQWSISGPGRAFRILPALDGLGIAMCIHSINRALVSAAMGGLALAYVWYSISDDVLPFTFCRDWNLTAYEPEIKEVDTLMIQAGYPVEQLVDFKEVKTTTVGTRDLGWRNAHYREELKQYHRSHKRNKHTAAVCKETYPKGYPPVYRTPAYNFFYVELMHYREDHSVAKVNTTLIISIMAVWATIWLFLLWEKISYGRIVWNNMYPWFAGVPWIWALFLLFTGIRIIVAKPSIWHENFEIRGNRDVIAGITDAVVASTFIHAAGLGTEIIHGKGLNYYASGHIDPHLNSENLWHSGVLVLLTALTSGGSDLCALTDSLQIRGVTNVQESSTWILPMYSKCAMQSGEHTHATSVVIFSGLTFSYINVSYVCIKTALHIIFEYRVKLVFMEQLIVGLTVTICAGLSVLFTTNGGLALLEGVDSIMGGVAVPLVCGLETLALIFVYRSHDFMSDINIATEENACSTRLGIQWQIIPFICFIVAIAKMASLINAEIPSSLMWVSGIMMFALILALPLRSIHNACRFANHPRRT